MKVAPVQSLASATDPVCEIMDQLKANPDCWHELETEDFRSFDLSRALVALDGTLVEPSAETAQDAVEAAFKARQPTIRGPSPWHVRIRNGCVDVAHGNSVPKLDSAAPTLAGHVSGPCRGGAE